MGYNQETDFDIIQLKHREEFEKSGAVPKSLFWGKGKQRLRFYQLTRDIHIKNGSRILDLGCGYADLYNYLVSEKGVQVEYTGVEMLEEFAEVAKNRYGDRIEVINANFLDAKKLHLDKTYDFTFISGALNYKLSTVSNYEYLERIIKEYLHCTGVLSFDLLSDKVDYMMDDYFYYNGGKVLETCYKYSRNVVLRNDCMPFEFCVQVRKDDSFSKETTTFNDFLKENGGVFTQNDFQGDFNWKKDVK